MGKRGRKKVVTRRAGVTPNLRSPAQERREANLAFRHHYPIYVMVDPEEARKPEGVWIDTPSPWKRLRFTLKPNEPLTLEEEEGELAWKPAGVKGPYRAGPITVVVDMGPDGEPIITLPKQKINNLSSPPDDPRAPPTGNPGRFCFFCFR